MNDKVTVSERFGTWFRAVLDDREAFEPNPAVREAWLDLQGSILDHDISTCGCIGCNVSRRGMFNAHLAATVSLERHDELQRRNA